VVGSIKMRSTVARIVKVTVFLLSIAGSFLAMGVCFATQSDAAFTGKDVPQMLLIFSSAVAASLAGPITWATLQHRKNGTRAIVSRAVFLFGLSALIAMVIWTLFTRGVVFGFGPMPLFFLLVPAALVLYLWRQQSALDHWPK
jgi:hypothetical protein